MFLFLCLILDSFCFMVGGGWQPLLGNWPIFSGTISLVYFGSTWKVIFLILGLVGTARIMLGARLPTVIKLMLGTDEVGTSSEEEGPLAENKSNVSD